MTLRMTRRQYADLYGPTAGDRVRLADTDLLIRIERDLTVPGEEAKFGGGKVIRDGMGQSARATRSDATLDTVITNAVIVDHWGIVKADIGIRDGHRRRARQPHPFHLPADCYRGGQRRPHDTARRRHRPGDGHCGDDVHAG